MQVARHAVAELAFESGALPVTDTLDTIDVYASVVAPSGLERTVPAFWAGGREWKLRYSSAEVGEHTFRIGGDLADLAGSEGVIEVVPAAMPTSPLLQHGPVRVAAGGRHLEHEDGAPFFWLADTWWHLATGRFRWPDIVLDLVADRVAKGFTVVQLVAGMSCETRPFGAEMANSGGFPWDESWQHLNPAWFDEVDTKVAALVEAGLLPCIVGSWGYWLTIAGEAAMRRHWRYVVARYGAYPVVWCVAGETSQPPYEMLSSPDVASLFAVQRAAWQRVATEVRALDAFHRPMTTHPIPGHTDRGSRELDPSLLDLDMLQTGHADLQSSDHALATLRLAIAANRMPVINGEPSYEGIFGASWASTQRFMFWTHMLAGAAGHSYGTLGIAVFNSGVDDYFGTTRCNDNPWRESRDFPGSTHLGIGKRILESLDWQRFEPHAEWISPSWADGDEIDNGRPHAAGIPGGVRIFYFPPLAFRRCHFGWPTAAREVVLRDLDDSVAYVACWIDPRSGARRPNFVVRSRNGEHRMHAGIAAGVAPTGEDWVLLLSPAGSRTA